MRRRMRVWKLGFRDFKGIDYINKENLKSKKPKDRIYNLNLPIPKITHIKNNKKEKVFSERSLRARI